MMISVSEIYIQNHEYMKPYCKVLFKDPAANFFFSDYSWSRVEGGKANGDGQEVTVKKTNKQFN